MFALISFFALWAVLAETSPFSTGPCPDIPAVPNFDIKQFIEKPWFHLYEDQTKQLPFYTGKKCIQKQFKHSDGSKIIEAVSYSLSTENSQPHWHTCKGQLTETPGAFVFLPPNSSYPYESIEYRIVDLDYNSYGVCYACAYDKKTNKRFESIGICGRSLTLPEGKLEEIKTMFKNKGLEVNFIPTDWSDCRARCN